MWFTLLDAKARDQDEAWKQTIYLLVPSISRTFLRLLCSLCRSECYCVCNFIVFKRSSELPASCSLSLSSHRYTAERDEGEEERKFCNVNFPVLLEFHFTLPRWRTSLLACSLSFRMNFNRGEWGGEERDRELMMHALIILLYNCQNEREDVAELTFSSPHTKVLSLSLSLQRRHEKLFHLGSPHHFLSSPVFYVEQKQAAEIEIYGKVQSRSSSCVWETMTFIMMMLNWFNFHGTAHRFLL